MKGFITLVVLAGLSIGANALADDRENNCELASKMFMYDRHFYDLKEGADSATVLSRSIYKNKKCYSVMIEFYNKQGKAWHRRTVFDPLERELYALFQQANGDELFTCAIKVDGERARCLGSEDFERAVQKRYGFDVKLPSDRPSHTSLQEAR